MWLDIENIKGNEDKAMNEMNNSAIVLAQKKKEIEEQIRQLYEQRRDLESTMRYEAKAIGEVSLRELVETAVRETEKTFPQYGTVACQGIPGAYSMQAANKIFAYPDVLYVKTFDAVFQAIEKGLCNYGLLPIENSTAGSVNRIYDLMMQHRFYIVRSLRLKINHSLLVKPGVKKSEITDIYSHEQALAQCSEYLKTMPLAEVHIVENTATAAKLVAESSSRTVAALASSACMTEYGLTVAEENVQDRNDNYTRFICIAKKPEIYPGANRTSVMAVLAHRKGSLYRILKLLNDYDCNLTKLESRPRHDQDFEFQFYFDFETSIYEEPFYELLERLQIECEEFEYLGSYSETAL